MAGKLSLVPTPIGNLSDMTYRAVEVLKEADIILAEDTRTSRKLLQHYGIDKPLQSFHKFNEHRARARIGELLAAGKHMAYITDAGTPGISDPGYLLVREAIERNIPVETLPGPTALIPALVNSGLPAERFVFEGFLPVKKGRKTRLEFLRNEPRTMIFYESPHRLLKTLRQLAEVFGPGRPASVSRELSKKFEETRRDTLAGLADYYEAHPPKGEIVLVVGGKRD